MQTVVSKYVMKRSEYSFKYVWTDKYISKSTIDLNPMYSILNSKWFNMSVNQIKMSQRES